jgi:hypothetical protein
MSLADTGLRRLRQAIQNNEVSFPSQVPIFPRQSRIDIQWRLVELYFIHNWSCAGLGKRYEITEERVQQIIKQWVIRAKLLGYLQEIPPRSVEIDTCQAVSTAPAWALNMARAEPSTVHE